MSKKNLFIIIVFLLSSMAFGQKVPLWEKDLGEPIKDHNFINDGKYIFFTSNEYIWCYNASTGEEIWNKGIPDFEEKGISLLLGEMYLTNSDNKLQAYDAVTGKLLWEQEYKGIDQEDYRSMEFIKNNAVLRYDDNEVGIDLNNGNELFRMEVDYWGELVDLGTFNYVVLDKQNKMFVLEDSEKAVLFDITNGNRVFEAKDFDINSDLIKEKLPWFYKTAAGDFLLCVLDDGAVVVDVKNNKELARREFSIDGDINVLLPTAEGCAVMGSDKFVHFNFKTGEVKEFEFSVDDLRTLHTCKAGDKDLLIISMEDKIASIDLAGGKVLWVTKEDDPDFDGYAHRYLATDGNNIILTYVKATVFSADYGTYLYLMSIDGITGKVNYKIPAIAWKGALANFQRNIAKGITGLVSALANVATVGAASDATSNVTEVINNLMGYDNIGFEYQSFKYGKDNYIFYIGGSNSNSTSQPFWNPATREEPGEGFVSINYKTGKVNYQSYFPIAEDLNNLEIANLPPLSIDKNLAYAAGEERVVKFNLDTGEKFWELSVPDKFIRETTVIDDILYLKYGLQIFDVYLKEDEVEVKKNKDEDPYGFVAVDDATGKILWEKETTTDPVLLTPKFSINNYYSPESKLLFFADLENLYALKMGRDGGNYAWQINFDDAGIGEFDYEETYAIIEKLIGSVPRTSSTSTYIGGGWSWKTTRTTGGYSADAVSKFFDDASGADLFSTYESWGNYWGVSAKKCLRVLFGSDKIVVFGPEKIGLINSADGKIDWTKEWDFDNREVHYVPQVINSSIVYAMDGKLTLIDLLTGEEAYTTKISDKSKFFESPSKSNIFTLDDEEIAGYPLTTK
ncbi:MAG: PQQ-binding-like beta-propeller repeat protein [Ignavibacteriaceae bacterium]|nr:PQQ-binding-like beta-propeller repeat protein [Ignavibacteriaceae bacterium]